jgi:ribosomal protein S18 acetylase RimI-like enzyme
MTAILRTVPATADRWADVRTMLTPGNNPQGCWCLAWRLTSGEFGRASGAEREARLRALVEAEPAPGVLAYLDETVVGWCNVGPRTAMGRLVRSRTIPAIDDRPVWSVVCFVVRTGYRRRGIAEELLNAAVDHAAASGAPAIEGYPVDPDGTRLSTSLMYVGTVGMFERAGFHKVRRTAATSARLTRWVMRRDLL